MVADKYKLPQKFINQLRKTEETSMGAHVVRVVTKDGKIFKNVAIAYCQEIVAVYGYEGLAFKIKDIASMRVTHREDYPSNFKGFMTFEEIHKIKKAEK